MANINPSAPFVENSLPGFTNFNMSCTRTTSLALGAVTPVYVKEVLPNDRIRIKPILRIRTLPLQSALLGSFSLRVAWFYESDANLYGYLDNDDAVSGSQLNQMKLHTIPVSGSTSGSGSAFGKFVSAVSSGSLANYLYAPVGFRPIYSGSAGVTTHAQFDAGRWFGFWDIYRNFYVNRQISSFPIFKTSNASVSSGQLVDDSSFRDISVSSLDLMFKKLRTYDDGVSLPVFISSFSGSSLTNLQYLAGNSFSQEISSGLPSDLSKAKLNPLSGLPLCNFRADVFTRMMSASSSTGPVSFQSNVGSLVTASRLFAFFNNIDITGGRVSDWMRFRWGVDIKRTPDKPICLSVDTITLSVDDLRTTSDTSSQAAGSQVGYVDVGSRLSKVSFNNKTNFGGNLFCIVTIVPNVVYSQGVEQEVLATKFMDKYNPEFANENFVTLPRPLFAALPTVTTTQSGSPATFTTGFNYDNNFWDSTFGRTTSWWHYQTDVNRAYGDVSAEGPLSTWVLSRNFYDRVSPSSENNLTNTVVNTTYVFPHHFNYAFADASDTAQNFVLQFGIDANFKRLMPSYGQPKIK